MFLESAAMIEKIRTMWEIPELRKKLIVTFIILFIFRLGVYIPLPGNPAGLGQIFGGFGFLQGWMNAFTGGALEKGGLFALGIIPYITSSIIFQMLGHVIPAFEKMLKEGRAGQQRIQQYARYATVLVAAFQAFVLVSQFVAQNRAAPTPALSETGFWSFQFPAILSLVAGSIFCMWLGEQITEFGIGEGASVLIMANIIADMPFTIAAIAQSASLVPEAGKVWSGQIVVLFAIYVGVVVGIIFITQGQRRIPMQSARQVRGMGMSLGTRSYLPLRVNQAGVIPVIFASAMLQFPIGFLQWAGWGFAEAFHPDRFLYIVPYVALIFVFAFFYTSMVFNPNEWADNLKQYGSFIPGIRPGPHTAEYLEKIMNRVTLAGAAFLAALSVFPTMIGFFLLRDAPPDMWLVLRFMGGTGLLIVVGVMLDVTQKIESHLLMRQREGFMHKTRMRGRFG